MSISYVVHLFHPFNPFHFCRAKKVHDGVVHASKIYPSAYVIMIIVGAVKESFVKYWLSSSINEIAGQYVKPLIISIHQYIL